MLPSVQFAISVISYTKEAALVPAPPNHIQMGLLVLVNIISEPFIYLFLLACSSHCAECDAAGCKVCDDGYELESEKTCASPPPPPVSREEAGSSGGGISGGIIAAIVGGSLVIFSSAAYSIYKFAAKRRRSDTHPYDQNKNSPGLEVSNPVSPTHTEVSNLVP